MSDLPSVGRRPASKQSRARAGGDVGWLVAIVLVALNLRAVIASVPPLAVELGADLQLGKVATGALTAVPVACMGLFAPVAAYATRFGRQSTVLSAGLVLIGVGAAARGIPGAVALYSATAVAGIGIAIAGTLLPGLVRNRSPQRVGPVTGLYTAALIAGALLASSLTQPVRALLNVDAQTVLAVWAVPAVVAVLAWQRVNQGGATAPVSSTVEPPTRMPWRDGSAWLGTAFMGAQSLLFYGSLAWLAPMSMQHGLSGQDAGLLLGLFSATQVVTAFAVPALAHRTGDVRLWVAASVGTATVGLFLVALAPDALGGAMWVWAALLGLGAGGTFSLALGAITQLAPSSAAAPAYSGMAFLVGYLIAAVGPVLLGFLAEATGGYRIPFLTLALLGPVAIVLGVTAAGRARALSQAPPSRR